MSEKIKEKIKGSTTAIAISIISALLGTCSGLVCFIYETQMTQAQGDIASVTTKTDKNTVDVATVEQSVSDLKSGQSTELEYLKLIAEKLK